MLVADTNTKLEKADFKNCIIYGTNDNELELDLKSSPLSNHHFKNCILKTDNNTSTSDTAHFTSLHNVDPLFKDTDANDYDLKSNSGADNIGDGSFVVGGILFDILGRNRSTIIPDAGAYEKQ